MLIVEINSSRQSMLLKRVTIIVVLVSFVNEACSVVVKALPY